MWISFIILFGIALLGLELIEGNKITTTEYYGFRDMGFFYIGMMCMIASALYPIFLLSLSMIIRKVRITPLSR